MRIVLPLLVLALAACYSPRNVGPGPDGYAAGLYGAGYEEPLRASLWIDPYTGFASFDLSRDAHVALFAWTAGGHFNMIYPAIGHGMRQDFFAGRHNVRALRMPGGQFARSRQASAMYASQGPMRGPTYFILIASDEPLEVQPFYGRASWIQRAHWGSNPYTATEVLASQVVPRPASTEWTAAYHVVWFEDQWQPRDQYRWIQCPSGVTITVPTHALYAGWVQCPTGDVADPVPGDTADGADAAHMARIAERVGQRRGESSSMDADRASEAEVAAMIRRLHEARGRTPDEVEERPVAIWNRIDRAGAVPTASRERPDVRPDRADRDDRVRAASRTGTQRPGARARPPARADQPRPQADRPQPRAERSRPQAERPRPQAERPRPQAERPRPQAERPRPQAERPTPQAERPTPQVERAAPARPDDRD